MFMKKVSMEHRSFCWGEVDLVILIYRHLDFVLEFYNRGEAESCKNTDWEKFMCDSCYIIRFTSQVLAKKVS